jgi:hypothetical protein
VDAAAFCARRDRRADREICERSTARGREMLLRTAKSCGPDAPTLASSSRSSVGPTGLRQNLTLRMTVAKEPGHRGARHKPLKPLRAGMPGDPGGPVASTPVLSTLHRGLRVQRAPGIPHALKGGERFVQSSGASRRGVANARLRNSGQHQCARHART